MGKIVNGFDLLENQNAYFHFRLMRMHEHGLNGRENTRMYTKKPRCVGTSGNFITASLVDTKPAIIVLIFGYGTAFSVFLLEMFVERLKKRRQIFLDNEHSPSDDIRNT